MFVQLFRLDAQLKKIEKDKGFVRWSVTSDIYKDMQQFSNKKQKENISKLMAACARERWFLLKLKAKFAGMIVFDKCKLQFTYPFFKYSYNPFFKYSYNLIVILSFATLDIL